MANLELSKIKYIIPFGLEEKSFCGSVKMFSSLDLNDIKHS